MIVGCRLPTTRRVKIYFWKYQGDPTKLLSPIEREEDTSLFTSRKHLGKFNFFKQLEPFQFLDEKECCKINVDFETLNLIRNCIYVIPSKEDLEVEHSKCPQIGNVEEFVGTANNIRDKLKLELDTNEPKSIKL